MAVSKTVVFETLWFRLQLCDDAGQRREGGYLISHHASFALNGPRMDSHGQSR
jgi:hypothetical protein